MGDEDHAQRELAPHCRKERQHLGLHGDIERRHRLVGHQQAGAHGQRAGDGDALALAARELVRVAVGRVGGQADLLQQLGHQRGDGVARQALLDRPGGDGGAHGVPGVQRGVGILEHHLDLATHGQGALAHVGRQGMARKGELPTVGRDQPGEQPADGGLARARFTHQPQRLAGRQREADVARGGHFAGLFPQATAAAVGLAQLVDHQQRLPLGCGGNCRRPAVRNRCDQPLGVVVLRIAQHLLRRAALDHPTELHHRHLVGDLSHHAEVMGDEQQCHALAVLQLAHQRQDLRLGGDVQRGGRLVGDQQRGFQHQGRGDHHPLALAARQAERVGVDQPLGVGQADVAQCRQDPGAALSARQRLVSIEHLADLLADLHHRVQRGHRLLEDHADALAPNGAQLVLGQGQQVAAFEQDATGHRCHMRPGQEAHHRVGDHRLARARLTNHAQRLAGGNFQVDTLDRQRAVGTGGQPDGQAFDAQHWRVGRVIVVHRGFPSSRVFRPSFSPSPTRFSASTVSAIAKPGNTAIHQAWRRAVRAAPTM